MEILLNDNAWQVKGFWPWFPLYGGAADIGVELSGVTNWIPATVPGGVHSDLYRAGLIDHPYVDINSQKAEWVEHRWWVYQTKVKIPSNCGAKVELIFKGLDYLADVYVGDHHLGSHEGMYHPAVFDVTELCKHHDVLELNVLFRGAPAEMGQIGRTSMSSTQKSRFNYNWDFSTRLVNIGIWDDVTLKVSENFAIEEVAIHSDVVDGVGLVDVKAHVQKVVAKTGERSVRIEMTLYDLAGSVCAEYHEPLADSAQPVGGALWVHEPQLWYPNGYGSQPLYRLSMRIVEDTRVLDERLYSIGIRKFNYEQNEGSPAEALPYTFVVNDERIYIKGVNLVPFDHLYGNVTPAQYEWMIYLMKQANVNMVRIWGGGIIEKSLFYQLCDTHGILVWQEFIQSSSGVDNLPSKLPHFLELLEKSAIAALKDRRNYTSLAVWSGGNELENAEGAPASFDDENVAMLMRLVEQYDGHRLFLPTSASGPSKNVTRKKGVSHDVHGFWKYLGNPEHYTFYSDMDNLFHSEFGSDGSSCGKSLRKFLSPEEQRPSNMTDSLVWRHHGEWWETIYRDEAFFGKLAHLDVFADASQWLQAEGLRFILEANRRRQFQNSGSIVWQLNEPWPNVACSSLVDYYAETKMAYHWMKKVYSPTHVSLDYRKLDYRVGETFACPVFIHSNTAIEAEVVVEIKDVRGMVLHSQHHHVTTDGDCTKLVGEVRYAVQEVLAELFFVQLKLVSVGTCVAENLYIFSTRSERMYQSSLNFTGTISIRPLTDWEPSASPLFDLCLLKRAYRLTNESETVALHVHPEETSDAYWMFCDGAYESLFPGEERVVTIYCTRKAAGGFLASDHKEELQQGSIVPSITFQSLGKSVGQDDSSGTLPYLTYQPGSVH